MRARSREVNIFNMSLLDILTGMLGAFLFLMLGLVPYYAKAKKSGGGAGNQQPAVDMMFNVVTRWDNDAKVDVFLHSDSGWVGANEKSVPLSSRAKIVPNACPSSRGWAVTSVYANATDRYLLAVSPQGAFNPEDLRHMRFSMELMESESKTDGSGIKSYYPNVWASAFDASGTKPNTLYGVGWVVITKDTTKSSNPDDFNLQYDYTFNPLKDGDSLPDGAIPLPLGAPMSVTLVPSGPSTPTPTPGPDSAPTPTTSTAPPPSPPAAPAEKPSMWNPLNWFHSTPPAPNKQP